MGNYRLTDATSISDVRHVVMDFGATPFPVLEGQSVGILPPGVDEHGRPHHARQFSLASPRDGERPGYNNFALTVRRVTVDHAGQPAYGVCSNYVCDLKKGDTVQVIGPFGSSYLMPDDARANLLMVCTGTGSAPMRAMTERRRRWRGDGASGKLVLFFGAPPEELPYFAAAEAAEGFHRVHLSSWRLAGEPGRYVQDAIRGQAAGVGALLEDSQTYIYVCGVRGMEAGVLEALALAAGTRGLDWELLQARLRQEGRLHLETW